MKPRLSVTRTAGANLQTPQEGVYSIAWSIWESHEPRIQTLQGRKPQVTGSLTELIESGIQGIISGEAVSDYGEKYGLFGYHQPTNFGNEMLALWSYQMREGVPGGLAMMIVAPFEPGNECEMRGFSADARYLRDQAVKLLPVLIANSSNPEAFALKAVTGFTETNTFYDSPLPTGKVSGILLLR